MLTKPCPGCPFARDSIVSPERARDIIETARRKDTNFICHKSTPGPTRIERLPERITCRGFFDAEHKKNGTGQILRIIGRLGGFEELTLTDVEVKHAQETLTPYRDQSRERTRKKKAR